MSKISFVCIGSANDDSYFEQALEIYQQILDFTGQNGEIFKFEKTNSLKENESNVEITRKAMTEMMNKVCLVNFKPFEAVLKCGEYFKLECPVLIWPQPTSYKSNDKFGKPFIRNISKRLEICGFLSLSDIGSPVAISRHLIVPKIDQTRSQRKDKTSKYQKIDPSANDFEKLEHEIRSFYSKGEDNNSEDDDAKVAYISDSNKESMCVLLHGALKVENMAALILLSENWYGFIYSYADSKKKSNLMLNILPPGNKVIPWLGDLSYLGISDDLQHSVNLNFPVKSDKRSYSQNCVVWIKLAGLQSDLQKVLRHSKKLPEKTPHFYKELNRIRRAALSIGFVGLLESLASIFEREINVLPQNSNPDCAIQLQHAAIELRKIANRDLKTQIVALPTKYNQLSM